MGPLSRWAVNKSWQALAAWIAFLVAVAVVGIGFAGDYNDAFELPDTESTTAQELLESTAGGAEAGGGTAQVVWSPETGRVGDPRIAEAVEPALERIAALDSVACVQSPYGPTYGPDCERPEVMDPDAVAELPAAQQQAFQTASQAAEEASAPISQDQKVAFATITFEGGLEGLSTDDALVIMDEVETLDETEGLTVGASGPALAFAAGEPPSSEGIGLLVAIIILLIAFGSIIAAALPIVVAVVGLSAGLIMVTFAANFLDVATFAPTLAAMIGLGVGIDYALFVMNRFRQAKMAGHEAKAAALEAVNTAGRAVAFAGVTVIIALMGLWVLNINFFNGLSVAAAVTVLMVMLSALWMLPALLGLLGDRALGWRLPWARQPKQWHAEGGAWARYGRGLQRMPWVTLLASLAVVLIIAIPMLSMRLGFTDSGGRADGDPLKTGYVLMSEGFGPGVNGPFFIAVELPEAGDAEALGGVITAVEQTPGVASSLPTVEMIPLFVQPDTQIAGIQVFPDTNPQDPETTELLERLRNETLPAAQEATGATSHVGGFQAVSADFTTVLREAMPLFLGVVVGLGLLTLIVLFRSIVVPVTAAVTSLLSLSAAMGVTVAVFQWGWLSGLLGINQTGPIAPYLPVMVFAILFGLSMDYQVFLVSRMQEEWGRTKDNLTAVRRGLAGSGRVVAIAALIMSSVFLAFVPSPTQEIKLFGVALASAILIDAFIVRLVMVPSLMSVLGPVNWWLPGWMDRILPTITIEGGQDEIEDVPDPEPETVSTGTDT